MDDMGAITMGGIYLAVGVVVIVALIVLSRLMIRRSRNRVGKNWAWNQLGYRSAGATKYGPANVSTHYVRDYNGFEVHYMMHIRARFGKSEYASAWVCPLSAPARLGFQVVEAGIADSSLAARVDRAVSRAKYGWEKKFSEGIRTGDTGLDERVAVFGADAEAVRQFLVQPTVRATLLGLKHVDLTLTEWEARLDDPFLTNSWGLDDQPLVDLHNQVAELLTLAAGAAGTA